jgi:hypothetical protein
MAKLPPIPKFLKLATGRIKVNIVKGLSEDKLAEGIYNFAKRTIGVDSEIAEGSLVRAWLTIEHERIHAVLNDAGVNLPSEEIEEAVCNAIAADRVYQMTHRRNSD